MSLGPRFTKLWAAAAISNLGDGVMGVAFPLLVASITRDPLLVAGAAFANRIPWLLFALPAGALVDRMDRRRVMVAVDWFRSGAFAVFAAWIALGDIPLAMVYLGAFLVGAAETLFDTASEAVIPKLVDRDQLNTANGRLQAAEWATNSFAGPPLGALMWAIAITLPFAFDAASYVVAALLVGSIGGTFRTATVPEGPRRLRSEIGEGLRWLWSHTVLRTLSLMAGATNLVGTGIMAIFVLFAQDILGLGDVGYGIVLATIGAGGLVGAIGSPPVVRRIGQGTTLILSVAGLGVIALVMGATSNQWVAGVAAFFIGMLIAGWNVVAISLRQGLTPDQLRGRVASVARLLAWGSQPVGALAGGGLAAWLGLRGPFFVAAGVWLALAAAASPIVNNRRIAALEEAAGDGAS